MQNNLEEQWDGGFLNTHDTLNLDDYIDIQYPFNPSIRPQNNHRPTINPSLDKYIKYLTSSYFNEVLKESGLQDRCTALEVEHKHLIENIKELKSDLNDFKGKVENKFELISKGHKEDWRYFIAMAIAIAAALFTMLSYFKDQSPYEIESRKESVFEGKTIKPLDTSN